MARCTNCGAELGIGRFCTNCGARISSSAASAAPASASGPGSASQTAEAPLVTPPRQPGDPGYPPPPPHPPPGHTPTSHREQRRGIAPWAIAVLVLALAGSAALGTWLATSGSDDEPSGTTTGTDTPSATEPGTEPAEPTSPSSTDSPDAEVNDVSETASVAGPPPIPPGRDLNGQPVRYPVENLIDDSPETAYRLPGDASGSVITFQLAEATKIRQVGLVNGYTKTDSSGSSTVDWYPLNRRVLRVEWAFDDGTVIEQTLDPDVRELQLLEVEDIESGSVQLTILEVSPPGTGPGARNVTAISDVLLLGA